MLALLFTIADILVGNELSNLAKQNFYIFYFIIIIKFGLL